MFAVWAGAGFGGVGGLMFLLFGRAGERACLLCCLGGGEGGGGCVFIFLLLGRGEGGGGIFLLLLGFGPGSCLCVFAVGAGNGLHSLTSLTYRSAWLVFKGPNNKK